MLWHLLLRSFDLIKRLHEVARIQSGYLSRGRVEQLPDGEYRLLQARDVSPDDGVRWTSAIRFDPERDPNPYQVSKDDILLVARGQEHLAVLIREELTNTLASSVFHILRPRLEHVRPAYLAWCLNQPDVRAAINTGAGGTGISYLSRQVVEKLEVRIPSLGSQDRIINILNLWERAKSLRKRIEERQAHLVQSACRTLATAEPTEP